MDKIINKITFEPPIKGYLGYAFPLSILFAEGDSFLPWMYSNHNYIMMYGKKDFSLFNQSDNDWMHGNERVFKKHTVVLPKYILKRNDIVNDLIMGLVEKNYYIITKSDEYYIPGRRSYMNRHFDHENMVYGFDKTKKIFNIASYTDKGYFGGTEISFEDYITALNENEYDDFTLNIVSRYSEFKPKFNAERCKTLLSYYLSGCDKEFDLNNVDYYHGIDAQKNLYYYLEYVKDNNMDIDIRYFYYLWEHKKIMLDRINYMLDNGYVSGSRDEYAEYFDVVKKAEIIKGLNLKYNIIKRETTIKNMQELIHYIVGAEERILSKLIKNIIQ